MKPAGPPNGEKRGSLGPAGKNIIRLTIYNQVSCYLSRLSRRIERSFIPTSMLPSPKPPLGIENKENIGSE